MVTFLKTELHPCFPLFSLLKPLMQHSLEANFLGEIVTSHAVLDHLVEAEKKCNERSLPYHVICENHMLR